MIKLNLHEVVYLLLTFDDELYKNDEYVINNFVGTSLDVLEVLSELTENVPVVIDCLQFNSEDDNIYCLSVENLDDDAVLVSVVDAVNMTNGKFYAINGNIFVADYVSENFENDVASYKHANPGHIVRFTYDCCNCHDCEDDEDNNNEIYTEKNEHMIHQSWSDGTSYYSRSFSSSDSKKLDEISKEWSDFEKKFRKS